MENQGINNYCDSIKKQEVLARKMYGTLQMVLRHLYFGGHKQLSEQIGECLDEYDKAHEEAAIEAKDKQIKEQIVKHINNLTTGC